MKHIIGLGNPGRDYERTRHNAGFMVLELLGHKRGVRWKMDRVCNARRAVTGHVQLLQPQTMMNNSGESLIPLRNDQTPAQDLLIVCDDVNISLGALRLRASGGPGGHNGLESCLAHLGTEGVPRLRVGVGRPGMPNDLTDFVLGEFDRTERPVLDQVLAQAVEACEVWIEEGIHAAMNKMNSKPQQEGTR
jgi:PTH1 family peptidyl-tRNA hydrolase